MYWVAIIEDKRYRSGQSATGVDYCTNTGTDTALFYLKRDFNLL
jgi:hypothetical protein